MKSLRHTLPLLGLAATLAYAPHAAATDFTGNAAATTNYVWRGTTQTDDGSAVQGGLDYATDFGAYVGAWASNTDFDSYELDLYGGYSFEAGPVGVDIGAISYLYPQTKSTSGTNDGDIDWSEGYLGLSFEVGKMDLSLQANFSSNVFSTGEEAMYLEAGLDIPVAKDLTVSLHVGSYDFDADDPNDPDPTKTFAGFEDYTDYSISLSKGDFTFTYSDTDLESDLATSSSLDFSADDDPKIYVTWSSEFDLLK